MFSTVNEKNTFSMTFVANHEYYIEITPIGQASTNDFKSLSKEQRQCFLTNEVSKTSLFKTYTKNNCKYECHIKMAIEICSCAPWDFLHTSQKSECDVFGRTCFFNAMENLTISPIKYCEHCIDECDYIKYSKVITKQKKIQQNGMGEYFNLFSGSKWAKENCKGQRVFCDYFQDNNYTLIDKGIRNSFESIPDYRLRTKDFFASNFVKYNDLIIIHLKIMQPNVNVIDVRYTVSDKIAKFGSNFGIFAQITGCSLLAILNLIVIFFKCLFTPYKKD